MKFIKRVCQVFILITFAWSLVTVALISTPKCASDVKYCAPGSDFEFVDPNLDIHYVFHYDTSSEK